MPNERNLCQNMVLFDDQNVVMITSWLKVVAGVLVLRFSKVWPRAWHWTEALPVAVSHASS